MYTSIVVGTDGSETAAIAVQHALELAQLGGATLHIVHAYHPVNPVGAALGAIDPDAVRAALAEHGAAVCAEASAAAEQAGVAHETHVVAGDPSDALITVTEEVGADLLVVGNRGMTGVKRFVLGSVPNKVSHHAHCSVLIVDTGAPIA
ncbi:MAG: universal stress protein [Acidimicrobiia bacterium]